MRDKMQAYLNKCLARVWIQPVCLVPLASVFVDKLRTMRDSLIGKGLPRTREEVGS